MRFNKNIKYWLLAIPFIIFATTWGCSDKDTDYRDDGAYPPPSIEISSDSELEVATLGKSEMVMGSVNAPNQLRDLYATLISFDGESYNEITTDARVAYELSEMPTETDFVIEIPITAENTAGIKVVATDIFTKTTEQIIHIGRINGIPPTITFEKEDLGELDFQSTVTVKVKVKGKIGLKSIAYVLAQSTPYRALGTPVEIKAKGDLEEDFEFEVTIDHEDANAIAIVATDNDGYSRQQFVNFTIEGIPNERAAVFKNIIMATEWEIPTEPNKPYLFSVAGVEIGGNTKHVISLDEAKQAGNKASLDFMFANIWRNPSGTRVGNHGFAYVGAARYDGGPIGRGIDKPWIENCIRNEVYFKMIPEDIVSELDLDNFFETTTGNFRTYEYLNQLSQLVAVNSSIRQIYQRTDAGTAAGTPYLQIKDGSYMAILQVANGVKKYGIIKVVKAGDDSDALLPNGKIAYPEVAPIPYSGPNLGFDYTGVASLYGRTCELEIIIQL